MPQRRHGDARLRTPVSANPHRLHLALLVVGRRRRVALRRPRASGIKPTVGVLIPVFAVLALVVSVLGVGAYGLYAYNYYSQGLPDIAQIEHLNLPQTTRIYDRTGTHLMSMVHTEDRDWVDFAGIPKNIVDATVATEDKTFWTNPGVDVVGILRAALNNSDGTGIQGASTITQQVVKTLLVGDAATVDRKIREAILANRVSDDLTKEQVFAIYANDIYYGEGAYGISAAARRFFGKPLSDLTLAQETLLVGLPQSPSSLDPFDNPTGAEARQTVVVEAMEAAGYITAAVGDAALADPWNLVKWSDPVSPSPWFTDRVKEEAAAKVGGMDILATCGCVITTTLDVDLQAAAQKEVSGFIASLSSSWNVNNAALVAEDPKTGEVLAYVGSVDFNSTSPKVQGQFDSAGMADRPPGSSWKGIVYMSAMEAGDLNASSRLWDVSTNFGTAAAPYIPHDADGAYNGPITIRQAIRESRNIPAIEAMMAYGGVAGVVDMAGKLGITTKFDEGNLGPAFAIGTYGVKLTDMTAAYSTISDLGTRAVQTKMLRITDDTGALVYDAHDPNHGGTAPGVVTDPRFAYQLVDILKDNANKNGSWLTGPTADIGRPAIVKTGTDDSVRDTYSVGGIPQLTVGVWMGNADFSPMSASLHSYTGPMIVWKRFLQDAIKIKAIPVTDWAPPSGMVQASVCENRAMYGGYGFDQNQTDCPFGMAQEWVIPGLTDPDTKAATEPVQYGDVTTDESGNLLPPGCQEGTPVTKAIVLQALDPAWQNDLMAWYSKAQAGSQNRSGRFAWNTYTWVFPAISDVCPSPSPSPSESPSESPSPSPSPSESPSAAPTVTLSPTPIPTPASTPSPALTPMPTSTPTPPPSPALTPVPTPAATSTSSAVAG